MSINRKDFNTIEKLEGLCRIDPKFVIDKGLSLLSKYEGTSSSQDLAGLYKSIGFSFCFISKFEEAIKNSYIALDGFFSGNDRSGVAECYYNIGTIYFYAGDYSLALVNYKKSLDISFSLNNELKIANCYNGIGSVYYSIGQNENAIKYLLNALELSKKHKDNSLNIRISDGLATAYLNTKNYDRAIHYAKLALKYDDGSTSQFPVAKANFALGVTYSKLEKYANALKYFNIALGLFEKIGSQKEVISVKIEIAKIYAKKGKIKDLQKQLSECEILLAGKIFYSLEKELILLHIDLIKQNNSGHGLDKLYERLAAVQESIIHTYAVNNSELIGLSENVSSYENIELKKNAEQLQKANESLKTLTQIGEEIASISNVEGLIEKIYEKLNTLLDASMLSISIYNKASNELIFPLTIEKGKKLGSARINLEEKTRLAVICFNESKEIVINDVGKELKLITAKKQKAYIGESPESVVYLPLKFKGQVIGTLSVQSFSKNSYTEESVEILRNLSTYISIAVENAFLLNNLEEKVFQRTKEVNEQKEEVEKSYADIQLLSKVGQEITSSLKVESIVNRAYDFVSQLMNVEVFGIGLVNDAKTSLKMYLREREEIFNYTLELTEKKLAAICFNNKQEVVIQEADEIVNYFPDEDYSNPAGEVTESIMYLPIIHNDNCIGVITVQSFTKYVFQKQQIHILKNLATYAAVAIENTKAYENLQLLSLIGKDISSTFSIEQIADMLYHSISKLMDASAFILATFDNQRKTIRHVRIYEGGELIESDTTFHIDQKETLGTHCITHKKEILIKEHKEILDYLSHSKPVVGKPAESIIYIPLIHQNVALGFLSVQSFEQNVYNRQHVEVLKNIASYLSISLNNAQSHNQLREISEIGQEITSLNNIKEINQLVYNKLQAVMSLNGFGIAIYNQVNTTLDFFNYIENGKELGFHAEQLTAERYSTICFKNLETIHINNSEEAQCYVKGEYVVVDGDSTESIVYVPLMQKSKCIGVLTVQAFAANVFSKQDVSLIQNLAPYVAVAIENATSFNNLTQLSLIGKEVTSQSDIGKVTDILHERLSSFMDTDVLLVGLHDELNETVNFVRVYEESKIIAENLVRDVKDQTKTSSYCVKNKVEIVVNSSEELPAVIPNYYRNTGVGREPESLIFIPLIYEGKVLGVLSVQSFNKDAYTNEHLEILRNVASYLTVTINNIRSYETLHYIGKMGQQITSTLDLRSVFTTIHQGLNKLLDANYFIIALYDKEAQKVIYRYVIEDGEVHNKEVVIDINNENYPGGWAIRNKSVIHLNDLINEYHPYVKELKITTGVKLPSSVIYKPLIYENEVIGLISVQSDKKFAYGALELQIIDSLSSYATSALQNAITFEALERAKAEMEKLSIVASETDNAIIIANKNGEIEWVNEAYTDMTGFTLQDLFDRNKTSIQSMSTFEGISEKMVELLQKKESVNYEGVFIDKEGSRRFVQTTLTPILDNNREIYKLIAIDSDITLQKLAELEIREKNKDITDSINYAKRIQTAMLPSPGFIKTSLPESFVLFEPRDIVSGDFYWLTKTINDEIIIAAADCTGHGVPGAFLTIVGNNLLNQIVNVEGETRPGKILEKMNIRLLDRFSGNAETRIKDGMDVSICKLKKEDDKITVNYSGAFNSMYYVVEGQLFELNANRFAIGTPIENEELIFEEHSVELQKDSMIYLFSDGYPDQLGGPDGKKYLKKRFKEFLTNLSLVPIDNQMGSLKENLISWCGENQQVDDVLVIGIKV